MQFQKTVVLVVDDDTDLLATLRDFLEFEGFDVKTAESGEAGLERLETITPDLIILDITMPGIGGMGFLKEASSSGKLGSIPVLVFTARGNLESFFKDVQVAGFLSKPCDPNALLREVKRIAASVQGKAAPKFAGTRGLGRVLLVDDEGGSRHSIEHALTMDGFIVATVENGPDVVERAIVDKPDVILMKLVMERMNGDTAAAMLSEIPSTESIPVILYDDTGSSPRDRVMKDDGPGIRKFVKSRNPEELISMVRRMMGI